MKEKKKGRKQASKHVHLYFYHMNLQLDYIYNIDFIITLNQNLEILSQIATHWTLACIEF